MTASRYAKVVVCCLLLAAITLLGASLRGAVAASPPALSLPTGPVPVQYGPWLGGTKNSTLDVTLSSIGAGFDVHNGTYAGWCIQDFVNGVPSSATLYSSYGAMPSDVAALSWNKINYLLNHKQGSINDVQIAIWQLTGNPLPTSLGPVTPAAQAMLDAANANPGFVPMSGELMAVIVYSDGITNRNPSSFQEAIIEVPVPAPAVPKIDIRKQAEGPDTRTYTMSLDFSDDLNGPSLNASRWAYGAWNGGSYVPAFSNGALLLSGSSGAWVRTLNSYAGPRVLEGVVEFGAGPWQHFGFGSDGFSGDNYLLFSTYSSSDHLFVRSNRGSGEQQTDLGPLPTGLHQYRIVWQPRGTGTDDVLYYLDGTLRATHTVSSGSPLYVYLSHFSGAGYPPLRVDRVSLAPALNVPFTIVVTNIGNVALSNVTVTDAQVPGCAKLIGNLAAGAGTTYTCAAYNVTQSFTNEACVSGIDGGGPANDCDTSTVEIPKIKMVKLTNGVNADDPNGSNVPQIAPGNSGTWTYQVSVIGNIPIDEASIVVGDDFGTPKYPQDDFHPAPQTSGGFNIGDTNQNHKLDPGETWLYQQTFQALDLSNPPAEVKTVPGCGDGRPVYENTAVVAVTGTALIASDVDHYCNPPARFTLGDRVWYDQNQNGRQDPNEPGYNGVSVQLFNNASCTGTAIASTTTAAGPGAFGNGYYQFTNLLAGPYCVQFNNIPAGWSVSPANQGDDVGDSDADPSTRRITNITLTANDPNEDMGIYVPGTLGDNVRCVSTGLGLANITVSLFHDFDANGVADGPAIATTQTNASGFYQFTGLQVALAGDPNNTTRYIVTVDTADPDLGTCNTPIPPMTYNPPLDSNTPNNPNNDFSFQQPARFTLGDRVWYDQNQNGRQDPNEPGYNGISVQLFNNATCSGSPIASTTTAAGPGAFGNGYYQFTNLLAGPYCVQFNNIPAGWFVSPANQGDDVGDSDADPVTRRITNINLTANDPDEDMGIYVPGTLGDNVLCVSTGQGLANITVNLFKDFDANGVPDGPVFQTTQTNASGFYQFTGLEVALAGDPNNTTRYIVRVDTSDPDLGTCNVPIPPTSYNPPLTSTNPNDPNNDFRFEQPARFTLGDRVWYDQNQNGRQDPNEPGYNGVSVQLFNNASCSGTAIASTTTAAGPGAFGNGYYQFTNLLAGPYCVQFNNIPAGWSVSPANQGDDVGDSDADPTTRRITNINLTANDPNEDMGIYVPGTLGDNVRCVSTGQGLANITVRLYRDFNGDGVADGPAIATTQTNASGFYQLTGLEVALAGDPNNTTRYLVEVDTSDPDLGTCNVPIPPTRYNPPLDSNNPNNPNNDFSFQRPCLVTLGDRVWYDANLNGIQDAGEVGIDGVELDLLDANGDPVLDVNGNPITTMTANGGLYQFVVPCGSYLIEVQLPTGRTLTRVGVGSNRSVDSNPNPSIAPTISLPNGGSDPSIDFGLVNFQDYCPPSGTTGLPTPVGTLYWGVDASGNVYVRYDQSRGLNDNSYGVNRVSWPRDHKFGDLVGSDKAQLKFTDATGKVVLDILVDYISTKAGTPSGYASLGVTGGEGKVNVGQAAWVLAADTSLAKNLNTLGLCVGGNCSGGGTNLLVNSPPTVGSSSYDLPAGSPYTGWNFTNSYEVTISRLAFGSSSFGGVSVGEVHNSPPKTGSNAVAPVVCDGGAGVCTVTGGVATIKDKKFMWPLTNNGSGKATLTGLTLTWPQSNGQLLKIKFGKDVIWDKKANWTAGGLTLTSADFTTDVKRKSIDPGKTRMFTLEFQNNAGSDLSTYTVTAIFDSGCRVVFVPSQFGGNFCQTAPGSGRAKTLTMLFLDANGGDNTSYNCTTNCNTQDAGKVLVTGDPAPATQVWIRAVPTGKTGVLFEGLVDLNEAFVMSAASAGLSTFDTNTTVTLFRDSTRTTQLSSVQFHTSCSQPLNDGDYYGSLRLTGFSR